MSGPFVHQALVYSDVDDFLAGTVPFVLDGLEADDHVFAVTSRRNFAALGAALGGSADDVDFCDAETWYLTPSRTLLQYAQYVNGRDRRVRVIGEPVWHGRSEAAVEEWVRYESILNVAFADADAWIVCPYDASALDAGIVEFAHATHPQVCAHGEPMSTPRYLDTRALCAQLDAQDLDDPPSHAVSLPLTTGLGPLRTFAREHARAAGIDDEGVAAVEIAVNETLANAIVHGYGRGSMSAWHDPGSVVYEVVDEGDGLRDPLAGHLPPDPDSLGGFGLWLARQLADLVQVRTGKHGTRVRLHFAASTRARA